MEFSLHIVYNTRPIFIISSTKVSKRFLLTFSNLKTCYHRIASPFDSFSPVGNVCLGYHFNEYSVLFAVQAIEKLNFPHHTGFMRRNPGTGIPV